MPFFKKNQAFYNLPSAYGTNWYLVMAVYSVEMSFSGQRQNLRNCISDSINQFWDC